MGRLESEHDLGRDPPLDEIAVQELQDISDDGVDVDGCVFAPLLAEQPAQPAKHVVNALIPAHDVAKRAADANDIRGLGLEQVQRDVRVDGDGRQRLIDLVREGAGQRAERHHAAGVRQFILQLAGTMFGALLIGDIAHEAEHVTLVHGDSPYLVEPFLVAYPQRVLQCRRLFRSARLLEAVDEPCREVRRQHIHDVPADELGSAASAR